MTVNNADLYVAGLWDWGFLDDCFDDTKIRVSDIDGMVERNGRFLMIETKAEGVEIPVGQRIMFENFVRQNNHVLIIWGRQGDATFSLSLITPRRTVNYCDRDEAFIKYIVSQWFKYANAKKSGAS